MAGGPVRRARLYATARGLFALLFEARDQLLPHIREYSPITHLSRDDPPVFLEFPNEKGAPVVGIAQQDPTHSAVQGLKLTEALSAAGVEAVLTYPAAPDAKYGTMADFLTAKLKRREGSLTSAAGAGRN